MVVLIDTENSHPYTKSHSNSQILKILFAPQHKQNTSTIVSVSWSLLWYAHTLLLTKHNQHKVSTQHSNTANMAPFGKRKETGMWYLKPMHQASPEQAMLIYDDLAGPAKKAPVVPNAYTQSQQDAIAQNFGIKPKSGSSTKPMTITTVTGQKSDTSAKRTISQVQKRVNDHQQLWDQLWFWFHCYPGIDHGFLCQTHLAKYWHCH